MRGAVPIYDTGVKGDVSFAGELGYAPHRRVLVNLTGNRRFQAGVRTGSELETDLNATLQLLLTQRGKFNFMFTRNQSDRVTGDTQISVAFANRFEYKITRNTIFSAAVTRYKRTSTLKLSEFEDNEGKLGIRFTW